MARLMFAKLEVWVVVLLFLVGLPGVIAFGFFVLDGATGGKKFGNTALAAVQIAKIPETIKDVVKPNDRLQIWNSERFDGRPTGWRTPLATMPRIDGYLLLSRYDGTIRRHKVELVSMRDWKVKYTWSPVAKKLFEGASVTSEFSDFGTLNTEMFREISPLLLANGDVIAKDHYSPLFRIDACGRRKWMNDDKVFHHSTERDATGNLWVPSLIDPQSVDGVPHDFAEDQIVQLNTDGKVIFSRSVTQLMLDSGFDYLLFTNGSYVSDPTHLNDIEPVLADGPYWKRGDVFLSLRNISTIMLYRPSTDKIVWLKQGPWVAQHDVDILDDHRISVYDNHAEDRGYGPFFKSSSRIAIYDFRADSVSELFPDLMKSENVRTQDGGLFAVLPGGYALIEDVTEARLLVAAPDGRLAAEFTNRAANGKIYQLGWSRYIDRILGEQVLGAVNSAHCNR